MYLYHGTKQSYGEKILNDGKIKSNIQRNYGDSFFKSYRTTNGLVYLTNNLSKATYYGNKNCFIFDEQENEEYFYVFRMDIDIDLLLPDKDELRAYGMPEDSTLEKSLKECGSATIPNDVILKDYNGYYVKIPSSICEDSSEQLSFMCDFKALFQIEFRGSLNEFQKNYIKESYEKFEKLFSWIKI